MIKNNVVRTGEYLCAVGENWQPCESVGMPWVGFWTVTEAI